jgi:hypothetical protein
MPKLVEDLRNIAANPGAHSKAEVVEILLAAADKIEAKRIEIARMRSEGRPQRQST